MWRINVKPLYHSAKICVPYWREQKRAGLFLNLSSISASRPRPGVVWYAASKGAVTAVCDAYVHKLLTTDKLAGN